jgi:hypothetical protein
MHAVVCKRNKVSILRFTSGRPNTSIVTLFTPACMRTSDRGALSYRTKNQKIKYINS